MKFNFQPVTPYLQSNGMTHLGEKPEDFGLRFVGNVQSDGGGRRSYFNNSKRSNGWYCDDDQNETCFGVVYQLPGRKGESLFVAGYDFSDQDGGLVFDLGNIFKENRKNGFHFDDMEYLDAARNAAISADNMAKLQAERAREYDSAWRAGSRWALLGEDIASERSELLEILAERRGLKNTPGYPALCRAIRKQVLSHWQAIQAMRKSQKTLLSGCDETNYFYPSTELRGAFNDGASCH
jgi:hypothetical protein